MINTYYTGKLIQVGFLIQMKDLAVTLATSLLAFVAVYLITMLFDDHIAKIIIGILVGLFLYILIAFLFNFREIDYLKSLLN